MAQFSEISGSIMIKKMLNFDLWIAVGVSFRKSAWPSLPKSLSFLNENSKISENMRHMIPNKHADFYGDQPIGSAITVEKTDFLKLHTVYWL